MTEDKSGGTLTITEDTGFPVLAVIGYFEEKTFGRVEAEVETFLGDGKTSLIVDFGGCVALNSIALGKFLFLTMKIVEDYQGTLFLTQANATMLRVFELAGITPTAKTAPMIADAVAKLKAQGS